MFSKTFFFTTANLNRALFTEIFVVYMEIECDEYVKTHPYRFCRDFCAETSIDREAFNICVEDCVKKIETMC